MRATSHVTKHRIAKVGTGKKKYRGGETYHTKSKRNNFCRSPWHIAEKANESPTIVNPHFRSKKEKRRGGDAMPKQAAFSDTLGFCISRFFVLDGLESLKGKPLRQ